MNWLLLILVLLLSSAAFSALGAFVSVAVREVFEAQTLANFVRFPMMFLGGVFVPLFYYMGMPLAQACPSAFMHIYWVTAA